MLNLNHTDASGNYQLSPAMDSVGLVNVNGSGTTTLPGNNSYFGITSINAGTLRAGADTGLSPSSDFVVAAGDTLDASTYSPTVLSLDSGGVVTLAAGGSSSVLTVAQNYSGNRSSVAQNTALGDSRSATPKLVVQGDTISNTTLNITNLSGAGAQTNVNGILVVQVDGASNGTFSLPAPGYVVAGGFRYTLAKVGKHWYLQSDQQAETVGPDPDQTPKPTTAPTPVPTLGALGMAVMATLMAAVGLRRHRRTL